MTILGGEDAPVVVITGPTGAGKSTLCRWLAARGAFVLSADRVGHEMLLDEGVHDALVGTFGDEILTSGGEIDRSRLGRRVFSDPQALAALNEIVHPPLVAEVERRIARLRRSRGVPLIVVDAALHFQFSPPLPSDCVVGVSADAPTLKTRIMQRDQLGEAEAEQRLARQSDVLKDVARADIVLDGGIEMGELRDALFAALDERLGTKLTASDPGYFR